jgi:hypothetical protein
MQEKLENTYALSFLMIPKKFGHDQNLLDIFVHKSFGPVQKETSCIGSIDRGFQMSFMPQLISECPFGVFKSSKKTNEIFSRISALASKKISNQKNKGTFYR